MTFDDSSFEAINVKFVKDDEQQKPSEVISYKMSQEEILERYGPPKLNKYMLTVMLSEGKSVSEIAKAHGMRGTDVQHLIERYEINYEKMQERNKLREAEEMKRTALLIDAIEKLPKDKFIQRVEERKTTAEIAKEFVLTIPIATKLKRFYCMTASTEKDANKYGYNEKEMPVIFKQAIELGLVGVGSKAVEAPVENEPGIKEDTITQAETKNAKEYQASEKPKDQTETLKEQAESPPEESYEKLSYENIDTIATDRVEDKPLDLLKEILSFESIGSSIEIAGSLVGIEQIVASLNKSVRLKVIVSEV